MPPSLDSALVPAEQLPPSQQPAPPVGAQLAHGAFWTILFSVLNKGVAFGCQIALAWFLLPEDVGLVAMALSVSSVAVLISGMNLKNVLIQRQDRFDEEVGQVFWLSLAMGLAGSLLLAIAAPLAALAFRDPRVMPLLLLIAVSTFFGSAPAVYAAVLSRDLRFRAIAALQFVGGLIGNLGAVALAALHFGPYSLVLPGIASSVFALAATRAAAGRVSIPRPAPSQWRGLLAPAGWLMLNSLLTAVLGYGASFIIGVQHDAKVAGYYFWGFNLASQAVFLLSANLQSILFPALTRLNSEPDRQYQAYRKASLVLLAATVPVCILQILLAEPVIKLVFHDRWLPSTGVVQGLSIGLLTQSVGLLAGSLLLARGSFRTLCLLTGVSAALTLVATAAGSFVGRQSAVALSVGLTALVTNLLPGLVVLRLMGQDARRLMEVLKTPFLLGLTVGAFGWALKHLTGGMGALSQTVVVTLGTMLAFGGGAVLLLPDVRSVLDYWRKPRLTVPA